MQTQEDLAAILLFMSHKMMRSHSLLATGLYLDGDGPAGDTFFYEATYYNFSDLISKSNTIG